jgi:hypothetical protein
MGVPSTLDEAVTRVWRNNLRLLAARPLVPVAASAWLFLGRGDRAAAEQSWQPLVRGELRLRHIDAAHDEILQQLGAHLDDILTVSN